MKGIREGALLKKSLINLYLHISVSFCFAFVFVFNCVPLPVSLNSFKAQTERSFVFSDNND